MLQYIIIRKRNKSLQIKDIPVLIESVGCGSGETCKYDPVSVVQLDDLNAIIHELFNDGPSTHPKYALMVSKVHNVEGKWQSVCLPMNMRFRGMRILHHRWVRVNQKANTVAYVLFSESTPIIPIRQFFTILPIKEYKKIIIISSSSSKELGILLLVKIFLLKVIVFYSDLQRNKNCGESVTDISEYFMFGD